MWWQAMDQFYLTTLIQRIDECVYAKELVELVILALSTWLHTWWPGSWFCILGFQEYTPVDEPGSIWVSQQWGGHGRLCMLVS